jgi:hypothetical protein
MSTNTNFTAPTLDSVVVRATVERGRPSVTHGEGVVVRSGVKAGGIDPNHAEGIVIRSV